MVPSGVLPPQSHKHPPHLQPSTLGNDRMKERGEAKGKKSKGKGTTKKKGPWIQSKGGKSLPQGEEDQEQRSEYTRYTTGQSCGGAQETRSVGGSDRWNNPNNWEWCIYEHDYKWSPSDGAESSGRKEATHLMLGFGEFPNWRYGDIWTSKAQYAKFPNDDNLIGQWPRPSKKKSTDWLKWKDTQD